MFCSKCGNQVSEGTAFCPACGSPVAAQAQPQQPQYQQPQYQQPRQAAPAGDPMQAIKKNLHLIVVGLAALMLIWGILNLFSVFDVSVSSSAGGKSASEYTSVSDTADGLELLDGSAATVYIGNIFFGLTCLAAAAIGVLYFLKVTQNKPLYDQYIAKKLNFGPLFLMGGLGAIGVVLQFILYLFAGASGKMYGMKYSVSCGINWTSWMMLVIFAGIAAFDFFVLNKKEQKPAQPYAPMQ